MKILFLGDIVGPAGVTFLKRALPVVMAREGVDLVIANAENASGGTGITPATYKGLREAGVDLVTLGDHIYKKREIIPVREQAERVCKPATFPAEAPGRTFAVAPARDGTPVAVLCLLGRTFMRPVDCPFQAADRVLRELEGRVRCVVVD